MAACRQITEVVPGKKLTYSWRYPGYAGESFVTFEITAEGNKTKLKLTHAGLHTFPADATELRRENFEAGWTELINISLKNYLEKVPAGK